jgi:hypothetical protein
MDEIDRFVGDSNIANFVDRLATERDSAKRETLKRLLLEEENRFGATDERLSMAERHLTNGQALIVRQVNLIAKLDGNGRDTGEARRTLQNFEIVQSLFLHFRAQIYEEVERRRP